MTDVPVEVLDYRARARAEYGQWVAKVDILFDGALAYRAGQPVPVSNVELHKYDEQGLVEYVGEKPQPKQTKGSGGGG